MASLDKEVEKLLAFLKTQPLVPDSAEQEGQIKESSTKELTVKEVENEEIPVQASAEVDSLLSRISSDCSYADWFKVACALKHEGHAMSG